MLNFQSLSIYKRIISRQVFLQLRLMWSVTAEMAERDTLLVTEETLFVLANDRQKINLDRQLEGKKFSLLLTPHFNALLQGKISPNDDKYQASITFDSEDIAAYLNQLIKTNKYNFTIIQFIDTRSYSTI